MSREIRRVSGALAVRFEDWTTGAAIPAGRDFSVTADRGLRVPLCRRDGYHIFLGGLPDLLTVRSARYGSFSVRPLPDEGGFLRLTLVAEAACNGHDNGLKIPEEEGLWVGLRPPRGGYPVGAAPAGAREIVLAKRDFADLSHTCHLLLGREGEAIAVRVTASLGEGGYRLSAPLEAGLAARTWRALPLRLLPFLPGETLPIPAGVREVWLYHPARGTVEKLDWEVE